MYKYYIHYLKDYKLKKAQELYDLHNQYNGFITYKEANTDNSCAFALAFIEKYNELVHNYIHKDKSNLLNKLQNMNNLIEKNGVLSIHKCEYIIQPLQPLRQKAQSLLPLLSLIPIPVIG